MIFDTIYYDWDEISLAHPIDVDMYMRDYDYVIDYNPLGIHAYGDTQLNCEVAFQDELDKMYEDVALEPGVSLHKNGVGIKHAFLWLLNASH